MRAVSPVYENAEDRWGVREIVFAKDQPEYIPLPALKFRDGVVVTRWKMTWMERITVLFSGSVFLTMLTFNQPLTPVRLGVDAAEACMYTAEGDSRQ